METVPDFIHEIEISNDDDFEDMPAEDLLATVSDLLDPNSTDDPNACNYRCTQCGKRFKLPHHLKEHYKVHSEDRPYSCDYCDAKFKFNQGKRRHEDRVHLGLYIPDPEPRVKQYECQECHKWFERMSALLEHARIHTGERPYACDICGKFFRRQNDVNKHKLYHTGDKKHECKECGFKFYEKSKLTKHIRSVHKNERPFICDICGKSFTENRDLRRHHIVHSEVGQYVCEMCNKQFKRCDNFNAHRRKCGVKSDIVSAKYLLEDRPYECEECKLRFKTRYSLKKHEQRHLNRGVKPYECDKCKKKFTERKDLKRHYRLHTGEALYKCTLCNKHFIRKDYLDVHVKKIHADQQQSENELTTKTAKEQLESLAEALVSIKTEVVEGVVVQPVANNLNCKVVTIKFINPI